MRIAAEYIESVLAGNTALQAIINGKSFWELADEKTAFPFVTFSIRELKTATKDRAGEYEAQIFVWDDKLTDAADIGDLIKSDPGDLKYRGGRSGYTDTDARGAFIELNFNLRLRTL
jgi:hypothetical protein